MFLRKPIPFDMPTTWATADPNSEITLYEWYER